MCVCAHIAGVCCAMTAFETIQLSDLSKLPFCHDPTLGEEHCDGWYEFLVVSFKRVHTTTTNI